MNEKKQRLQIKKTTHKEKETQKELLGGTREIRGGRNESNLKQKKREGE